MKYQLFFLLLIILFSFKPADDERARLNKVWVDDNNNYTTVGNIGVTFTNYGVFGDGFVTQSPTDQPSCVYPKGSGIEHIFDGGLWVGAQTPDGIKVSTGAFNSATIGSAGSNNFEFTNTDELTDIIEERSSLANAQYYSPDAVSHQDFVMSFSDTNLFIPGTSIQIPNHNPLGLAVELQTYAWNFPFADDFVILNYTIKNVGYKGDRQTLVKDTLENVYVGLWADLVVRNTNILPPRVGAPFYQDVGVGYVSNPDSGKMLYAYEIEGGSNYTEANSYVALVHLGATQQQDDDLYNSDVNFNWWFFSGGTEDWQMAPSTESARYERMRDGLDPFIYESEIQRQRGNFMNLMATGPFEKIEPDSSINVVFAIVCAKKFSSLPPSADNDITRRNLLENAGWAYRAYFGEDNNRNGVLDFAGTDSSEDVIQNGRLDRYILPTPPDPPRLKVIPDNGKVTLLWDETSEKSVDLISRQRDFEGFRVYRSFLGNDLGGGVYDNMQLIHEYDRRNGLFYDSGLDAIEMSQPIREYDAQSGDSITYKYRLEIDGLHNGWQYAFAVSAFDSGDAKLNLLSLESSRLQNAVVVSPGTPAADVSGDYKVGVYPNPYKTGALWDGGYERERKLYFYNLPARSRVRIYTLAGDLVDSFNHDAASYSGLDIQWYQNFSDGNTVFPGGEHAWDMVSSKDQALATGLYLFTVKDLDSKKIYKGKFVIIK